MGQYINSSSRLPSGFVFSTPCGVVKWKPPRQYDVQLKLPDVVLQYHGRMEQEAVGRLTTVITDGVSRGQQWVFAVMVSVFTPSGEKQRMYEVLPVSLVARPNSRWNAQYNYGEPGITVDLCSARDLLSGQMHQGLQQM